ncbi:Pr6Pr family membrane protein [Salinispira pacifica]|uniref:Pr6Pr family membrane protein n=1 Tax=Salinispira pacifica TaxID=1307761 RepID=UPI001184367A|nr:Pr6Pr family membrane protein [Salinispira pacifica]
MQSNIMVLVYLLLETALLLHRRRKASAGLRGSSSGALRAAASDEGDPDGGSASLLPSGLHGGVLLYILITGLVFNTMLAPSVESSGYDFLVIHLNHSITPLLFFLDWLVNRPRGSHHWHQLGVWLIYPVGYALFASLEGAAGGNFRYFFLDFTQPPAAYLAQIISVVGIFVLAAWVIIFINRRIVPERHGD